MPAWIDLAPGDMIRETPKRISYVSEAGRNKFGQRIVIALCECGKQFTACLGRLKSKRNNTNSCGCYRLEVARIVAGKMREIHLKNGTLRARSIIRNGYLECRRCKESKPLREMTPDSCVRKDGLKRWMKLCLDCKNKDSSRRYRNRSRTEPHHRLLELLQSSRSRAKKYGLEHTIQIADLGTIPAICPVLGIEISIETRNRRNSPSLDRIDNTKGYIPGNVRIVSHRANTLKNDATREELEALARDAARCAIPPLKLIA